MFQDSQLEEDHTSVNPNTVPTKIFSSMYSAPMEDKILKVHPTSSQNRTMDFNTFKVIFIFKICVNMYF